MKERRKLSLKDFEWFLFIAVMIVMFFSTQSYFGTANYSRIYRINTFCIIGFLLISVLANRGKLILEKKAVFSFLVVLIPYIMLFAFSIVFYFMSHRITQSNLIYYNVQPILICLMAIVAYISFGAKAIKGIIIAASLNYAVYIVTCVVKYGPMSLFSAGTDSEASSLLEVHELTFVFGIVVVYMIITNYFRKNSVKARWIILLTVFSLFGFKRILVFAMILGILLYFAIRKLKRPYVHLLIALFFIGLSIFWVYICSSWSTITNLSTRYGIDLMGRNWIYSNFYPYFEFSVSYIGAGVGYVQQLIGQISKMMFHGHTIGLHNDFLRLFIELGFIPYIVYFLTLLPVMMMWIKRRVGINAVTAYLVLWTVTLLCIATDNLLTYPNYMLTFTILLISAINNEPSTTRELKPVR
ncbi:MAG: hypothetical protein IJ903_08030 [Ruminococcus sp.]|nr:hypothetical protein [Ruminococcus sp.]